MSVGDMKPITTTRPTSDTTGTYAFFTLACGITWLLALPAASAWMHHRTPPPSAVACAGLSAFGPLLAALAIAGPRRQLGRVFGRWRTRPAWILLALCAAPLVHLVATALFVAIGGHPTRWFHPPGTPEAVAALVVFPLGEEFGWRGFAHPRMVDRFGPVRGCLIVGAVWGLWHLVYSVTPEAAGFDTFAFALTVVELPLYALLIGWVFERANRSMAVAIAFHLGAHLDHIERAPRTDLRLHLLHMAVLTASAAFAARSLYRQRRPSERSWSPEPIAARKSV
jgi:membrane protease YdiL (CAAX protease family)